MTTREKIVDRGKFLVLIGCAMTAFLIVVYAVIATTRPTGVDNYLTVVGPIFPVLLAMIVLGSQLDEVKRDVRTMSDKVDTVVHQTNGALTEQFDSVKDHVTAVGENAVTATAAARAEEAS